MNKESQNTTLLSAFDLHKHYRMGSEDLHVLRGVDLAVHQGEWLCILGSSGSGKSTLLHLLGGLDRPDQGGIEYMGSNVFHRSNPALNRYRNQQVGFVFQFYHLLPELTALENVLIAAKVGHNIFKWHSAKHAKHDRAVDLLDRLGLADRMKHRPNKLSGGERQRVAIARALMNEPAVLLADEPTGNLDKQTGEQILDVFREFHQAGQTIVMVTHDEKIANATDRRVVLVEGRLR